jgi:uncharacterized phage protein (predicted DNA packaging)
MLATVQDTKAALRIDHDDDDAMIEMLLRAASSQVMTYLKGSADDPYDYPEIPNDVQLAVMFLVGIYYRTMDSNPDGIFSDTELPAPVRSILWPYRIPVAI